LENRQHKNLISSLQQKGFQGVKERKRELERGKRTKEQMTIFTTHAQTIFLSW
jgi:hypothetical protein